MIIAPGMIRAAKNYRDTFIPNIRETNRSENKFPVGTIQYLTAGFQRTSTK
jgi:hypothetical protein